jgi:hypothetical protein
MTKQISYIDFKALLEQLPLEQEFNVTYALKKTRLVNENDDSKKTYEDPIKISKENIIGMNELVQIIEKTDIQLQSEIFFRKYNPNENSSKNMYEIEFSKKTSNNETMFISYFTK